MNIGFIGCGNMASAILKGIFENSNNNNFFVYDINSAALDSAKNSFNATICTSEADVITKSEIVFLAVKPNIISEVLTKAKNAISDQLIISIAAGKTLDYISSYVNDGTKLVRVMPNINAKVAEAISAYCHNNYVNEEDCKNVEALLNCTGKVIKLDEAYFPIFGVIGGCGPAFAYMFIDELARAGVKNGLKKDDALRIAAQTVYGSAKMILETDEHPYKLIDNVCSPGGTTIEGVLSLQKDGFDKAIHNAVQAAVDKDSKL